MSSNSTFLYALRQLQQAPMFTLTAVLTLALGIGGTTAIFSLMHDVMLRSLPVADPDSLYRIGSGTACCVQGGPQDEWGMYTYPLFQRLRDAAPEFEEVAAFQAAQARFSMLRPGHETVPKSLRGEFVTGNYFSVFGIRPLRGRLFSPADDAPGAAPVVVLSYRAWQTHWGADANVVGSTVNVQGQPFTISGVAPPGFFGETLRSDPPDLWIPLHQEPLINGEDSLLRQSISSWLRAIGRLKPGATIEGVGPRLTVVVRNFLEHEAGFPAVWMAGIRESLPKQRLEVVPAGNGVAEMREEYGRSLQILLAVCCLVLLIACANVANLLIARGLSRRTQTAVRLALGASRARLISQSLMESIVLAVLGGAAGLLVAYAAEKLLVALAFSDASYLPFSTTLSAPVLAFAIGLSLLTGVIFGIAPAWIATRRDPIEALRGANRSTSDHASLPRRVMLVMQAALSVVLVAGSVMMTRSLGNLQEQDFGFRKENLVMVNLTPPPSYYSPERLDALYRNLQDRLQQVAGVDSASLALYAPLTDNWGELIVVDGHPPAQLNENAIASWNRVSPGHFETVGQQVIRGRGITERDTKDTENIAVVNETFVRRFFPGEDPMDKRFGLDLPAYAQTFRIVGIVRDAKYTQPMQPARPMFFLPLAQSVKYEEEILQKIDSRSHFVGAAMLKTPLPAGELESTLKKVLAEVDANLTVIRVRNMEHHIALVFDRQRAVASLAGLFGLVALLLAGVGLYGVTAFSVVQRTGEIGVRIALGADAGRVLRLVLQGAFRTAGIGLLLGIPLAIGAGHLITSQLYGVNGLDPIALGLATLALGACAFIAALIPALRAAAIQPMQALRTD